MPTYNPIPLLHVLWRGAAQYLQGDARYDLLHRWPDLAPSTTTSSLAALSQMTCLRSLQLGLNNLYAAADGQVDLQQFSALTASSQLQSLQLWRSQHGEVSGIPHLPLPRGALQHMFPIGLQLQHLAELALRVDWLSHGPFPLVSWLAPCASAFAADAADLAMVAACCPHLQRLELVSTLQPTAEALRSLVQLQQRVQLRALVLGGGVVSDDTAPLLGQMSSLTHLKLVHAPSFTDCGLQHLTALYQLQWLEVYRVGISREVGSGSAGRPSEIGRSLHSYEIKILPDEVSHLQLCF